MWYVTKINGYNYYNRLIDFNENRDSPMFGSVKFYCGDKDLHVTDNFRIKTFVVDKDTFVCLSCINQKHV